MGATVMSTPCGKFLQLSNYKNKCGNKPLSTASSIFLLLCLAFFAYKFRSICFIVISKLFFKTEKRTL